jgi:hypothetical protein
MVGTRWLVLGLCLAFAAGRAATQETKPPLAGADKEEDKKKSLPALNAKVLRFAEARLGQQVGNGECWTLAREALVAAGARVPGVGGVGVLDFGTRLRPEDTILPGDIMQFSDARFVGRNRIQTAPKHTAVVARVNGTRIQVLHQNFGGVRKVQQGAFDLSELREGKVAFSRPVQAP